MRLPSNLSPRNSKWPLYWCHFNGSRLEHNHECWADVDSFTRQQYCLHVSKALRVKKHVDNENYTDDAMNHYSYCVHSFPKTDYYIVFNMNLWHIHFWELSLPHHTYITFTSGNWKLKPVYTSQRVHWDFLQIW